jgi:translation initiation factor 5
MAKINMNGDQNDPFYRYTMQRVSIQAQQHKTVFSNIDAILRDINQPFISQLTDEIKESFETSDIKLIPRTLDMLKTYLNIKYSTSWTYKNNTLLTSKTITQDDLQTTILDFIKKFVLCPNCNNPETILIKKNKTANNVKCLACSFVGKIK